MTGTTTNTRALDKRTSRRHFFKLLAGSPMLALAYPGSAAELAAIGFAGAAAAARLPGRGRRAFAVPTADRRWFTRLSGNLAGYSAQTPAAAQPSPPAPCDEHLSGQLVESPEQAINVWDFERVAHANTLPEHWAYIHMGVDDFETRKANREGFQRLMLRPRRLGQDATKLDTSVQLFGRRWDTPLFLCPVAALEAYHTEGESGAARAARARKILQIQSNQQLAVVRSHRRGEGRAALVPDLHGP